MWFVAPYPVPLGLTDLYGEYMLAFLLAFVISYTLRDTNMLQPPKAPPLAAWTSQASAVREPVEFTAKDGSRIRGWLYRAKQAADGGRDTHPFVLLFYGSN